VVLDELVDSDTFFERAARGEREVQPATTAPDHALGAAALPRSRPPAPVRPQPQRDDEGDARTAFRRFPARRIAAIGVPAVAIVGGAVLVAASLGGPTESMTPVVVERPPARPAPPSDVLAPRVARVSAQGHGRLAGVVYDPGSGVRSVQLVADGRRQDIERGACRPDCPAALRFSLTDSSPEQLRALTVVVADAAGNKAIAWQTLTAPTRKPQVAKLTARLERPAAPRADAVAGQLTDADGSPIRHGRVELVGVERTDDAIPRVAGAATTDTAGRWRIAGLDAREGSQVYRARHLADGDTKALSAPVRVTVRPDLALRTRRQGRVTVLTGRLQPAAAARLLLAVRRAGGWHTERTARATANGRFRLRIPVRMRGQVAVFVAPSPDLPYAPTGRVVDLARP
jgi:hypothetical protein